MYNDQLKINKLHTSVRKGYKLGSTNATWKKIKQATTNANNAAGSTTTSNDAQVNFIESGPFGELLLIYPARRVMEIWYWIPPQFKHAKSQDFSGDTLYFYGSIDISMHDTNSDLSEQDTLVHSVKIVKGNLKDGYRLLIVYKLKDLEFVLQIHDIGLNRGYSAFKQSLMLPEFFNASTTNDLSIKLNDKFIVIGNDEGYLYLYKYIHSSDSFIKSNVNDQLKNLKKSSCLPVLRDFNLLSKILDSDMLFKTSCFNSNPIFDLNNNWLVYSPTKCEYNQIKLNTYASNNSKTFTPVKLPNSKPLLNKLLESVSNQALDLLFKLSKFSSGKLNQYWYQDKLKNKEKEQEEDEDKEKQYDVTINSIKNSLNTLFNQTIHSFNETTHNLQMNDNQILKVVDLSNDKILSIFKTPDGVSNLSFNPYDLQLVNSNYRGDNFFIWDLLKLPNEVSLLGKFSRGKTSGVIDEIFWFTNSNNTQEFGNDNINNGDKNSGVDNLLSGTNSGFGCISKKSGSIHWFNINYLSGNLNNNLPNYLGKEFPVNTNLDTSSTLDKSFLSSWILSSTTKKYKKFVKLPSLLNLTPENMFQLNQLAVLDDHNNLKLISPLNGQHCYKFELPDKMTDPKLTTLDPIVLDFSDPDANDSIPLSQIEIETCKPFVNFLNFKNIEYSLYDFETKHDENEQRSDHKNFIEFYTQLNNNRIPYEKIKVDDTTKKSGSETNNNTDGATNLNENVDNDNEFIDKLVDDLTIDQNIS